MKPAKRLIDADALKTSARIEFATKHHAFCLQRIIDRQPAIDAVEVDHAHWIFTDEAWLLCSNCGQGFETFAGMNSMYRTPYCPHCGARMNEQRVENDFKNETPSSDQGGA